MEKPTAEIVKNSYRDAAGLLLNMFNDNEEAMLGILESNDDQRYLLSGMLAVTMMLTMRAYDEQATEVVKSLVNYLATVPDDEWQVIADHSKLM